MCDISFFSSWTYNRTPHPHTPTEESPAGQGHVCVVGLPLPPRSAESAPTPQVRLPHPSSLVQTVHPLQHSGEENGHLLVYKKWAVVQYHSSDYIIM